MQLRLCPQLLQADQHLIKAHFRAIQPLQDGATDGVVRQDIAPTQHGAVARHPHLRRQILRAQNTAALGGSHGNCDDDVLNPVSSGTPTQSNTHCDKAKDGTPYPIAATDLLQFWSMQITHKGGWPGRRP
jgi:hypothetical protein